MVKMKTIPQAVKEIRESDPSCYIGETSLRRWVKEGKVKHVKTGATTLVNMESLEEFLSGREV